MSADSFTERFMWNMVEQRGVYYSLSDVVAGRIPTHHPETGRYWGMDGTRSS